MNQEEIKKGLEEFIKQELVDMFPSLELDFADKKEVLIANIIDADPPPLPSEIDKFKESLAAKIKIEPTKKPIIIKAKFAVATETVYIVLHPISESGTLYERGSEYAGKFVERFLKDGQIRKRD